MYLLIVCSTDKDPLRLIEYVKFVRPNVKFRLLQSVPSSVSQRKYKSGSPEAVGIL